MIPAINVNIINAMKIKNITPMQLCQKLGWQGNSKRSQLYQYLKGKYTPGPKTLGLIAEALDVSVAYLITAKPDPYKALLAAGILADLWENDVISDAAIKADSNASLAATKAHDMMLSALNIMAALKEANMEQGFDPEAYVKLAKHERRKNDEDNYVSLIRELRDDG